MTDEISIINDDHQDYIASPFPDTDGVFFKVLKADELNNRVVMKFKFGANTALPRHIHHCRAVAYTISGEWEYDEGDFQQGHVAYEGVGNDHTPSSKTGAELFLFFDSDNGLFLDNILPCGTVIRLGMPFFKAFEGASQAKAATLDLEQLVEFIAPIEPS